MCPNSHMLCPHLGASKQTFQHISKGSSCISSLTERTSPLPKILASNLGPVLLKPKIFRPDTTRLSFSSSSSSSSSSSLPSIDLHLFFSEIFSYTTENSLSRSIEGLNSLSFSVNLIHKDYRAIPQTVQMQDPRMLLPEEVSKPKPRKKKSMTQTTPAVQLQGGKLKGVQDPLPPSSFKAPQKASKRKLKNDVTPSPPQQPERSNSDSLPDNSKSGNDYRALRRKYLLLEEESFVVGRELGEVENEVNTLEDEKLALLDQLVVLEGLIDPSELQPRGGLPVL